MIAIFVNDNRIIRQGQFKPKNMFKFIRSTDDIRGITFTGVITLYNWYDKTVLRDAYDALEERQPKLFK